MELRLTWEAVLAMIAILGFFSAVIALYIKLQFLGFSDTLIEKLDKRYVQKSEYAMREMRLRAELELATESDASEPGPD